MQSARDFIIRLRVHIEREEFELGELLHVLDPDRSRKIGIAIAERHAEACPRIGDCPRKG